NLAREVSPCAIHLCQGLRNNGIVGEAQRILAARKVQQWVMMETVDDKSWQGLLRRLEYRRIFSVWRSRLQGVLATGYRTPQWVVDRGMDASKVHPFAYFLPNPSRMSRQFDEASVFTVLYVGRFIPLKRIDLL